jgi:hypothetical protein
MRHPFDGIEPAPQQGQTRRSWLCTLLASLAGVIGFRGAARAVAPPIKVRTVAGPNPEPSSAAVAEEGAATKALGENGRGTTKALKEEAGRLTTKALREEAATAKRQEGGGATTLAIGEEGGRKNTRAKNEEGAAMPPDGRLISTAGFAEEGA